MRFDRTEVEPGRPILLGGWGGGSGRTLLSPATWTLCGSRVDGAVGGRRAPDPYAAVERDGAVWGIGAADLKGGSARSTQRSKQSRAPVCARRDRPHGLDSDEESGEPGLGRAPGCASSTRRIKRGELDADGAIYVEPTELAVYAAQIGFLIAEFAVEGQSAYFGRPERGVDALRQWRRRSSLWRIADRLPGGPEHELLGRPVLVVHSAEAGGPIAVPGSASAS